MRKFGTEAQTSGWAASLSASRPAVLLLSAKQVTEKNRTKTENLPQLFLLMKILKAGGTGRAQGRMTGKCSSPRSRSFSLFSQSSCG